MTPNQINERLAKLERAGAYYVEIIRENAAYILDCAMEQGSLVSIEGYQRDIDTARRALLALKGEVDRLRDVVAKMVRP